VSALTELVAEFKALARQAWSIPSVERAKALEQCAAALESALAAERGGVDDATLGALDMAAKWVDATATASHKPSAKNLRAMIEAEGAFTRTLAAERARVVAFCDSMETEAMTMAAKESGFYNDARYYDGRASAFRAVMTMLEDAAPRGTTTEA
jgi:hypothetical protein